MQALRTTLAAGVLLVAAACGSAGTGGTSARPATSAVTQAAGGPTTTAAPAVTVAPTSTDAVAMQNQAFGPKAITVKVGQTVTWTNMDVDSHTVTFDAGDVKSGVLAPNSTFAHLFGAAGTFAYHCTIHADMHGVVVVTP